MQTGGAVAGLGDAASELESIARHLREAGETELVRELNRRMRDAVGPVPDQIRQGLAPHLPNRYAAVLDADVRLGTSVRTNERNPGVSVTGTSRTRARKLRYVDEGRLTHPVFGDREVWRTQGEPSVQPGWFTGPAQDAEPGVRAAIDQALGDVAAKATRRGP